MPRHLTMSKFLTREDLEAARDEVVVLAQSFGPPYSRHARLALAENALRNILKTAPWDGEEGHRQSLKEARAYFERVSGNQS